MKFSPFIASLVSAAALSLSLSAQASVYVELGDAGDTAATAQSVAANTTEIQGRLGTADGADLFNFTWGGGLFAADTWGSQAANAPSRMDTMLFVYNTAGTLFAFSDDNPHCCDSAFSVNLSAGDYILAVSEFARNYNGPLSGFAGTSGYDGSYVIHTSEISGNGASVSEPATLAMFFMGLISLGFARTRKA